MSARAIAAVTGATGYLGTLLCGALGREGFEVRRLVRNPDVGAGDAAFDLRRGLDPSAVRDVDVLIHCAYDFTARSRSAIWEANVQGTRELLDVAHAAGVRRTILLSSMSAYAGTRQLYGRAKLANEIDAQARGMCVVRPGLVYGPGWGGTAGSLRALASLPVVPLVGASTYQFTAHEDDLASAIVELARTEATPQVPLGLANPDPINFRALLAGMALEATGRPARFLSVPWRALYAGMRLAEMALVPLPLRADSLLGLMRPAPAVPHVEVLKDLGIEFRPLELNGQAL